MIPVNQDAGAELTLAYWVLEEAELPASNSTRILVADCIRLLAKKKDTMKEAADFILAALIRARLNGERVNRFWFEDRKYLEQGPQQVGVWNGRETTEAELQAREAAQRKEDYEFWNGMGDKYKAEHPWKGPVPA
jgi:hypothetical protein